MNQQDKSVSLFSLFFSFAKIGFFTFGGGYAMLPLLEDFCIEKRKWISKEKLLDIYAIGQCTPGIIAVNTASYIGYEKRGVIGAIFATLGMVAPSFIIILFIATILENFNQNIYLIKAFKGIRIAVCGLMTSSLIKLAKKAINSVSTAVIAITALLCEIIFKCSPILLVVCILAYSAIVFSFKNKESNK